jgi:hypothetical protein
MMGRMPFNMAERLHFSKLELLVVELNPFLAVKQVFLLLVMQGH